MRTIGVLLVESFSLCYSRQLMLTEPQALLLPPRSVVCFGDLVLSLFELDASGSWRNSGAADSSPLIVHHMRPPHM